jgi:hypothetical protein
MNSRAITLEHVADAWKTAPAERRADALRVLHGTDRDAPQTGPKVYRWVEAARQLSVTTRCLRYAVDAAGIKPVRLPGRSRAFGIRATDLERLINGGLN